MNVSVVDPFGVTGDPTMPVLARALDPEEMQRRLSWLGPRLVCKGEPRLRGIRVLRHKPGRRCLIQYDLSFERQGIVSEPVALLGKVRAKGLDRTAYETVSHLWRSGFDADSPDGVSVAEPIAMFPELQMWLQRKMPGVMAAGIIGGPDGVSLARRIAAAAHKLHRGAIQPARRHTMADELRILRDRLRLVAVLRPNWCDRIERLIAAADRLGATVPEPIPVAIHRDFYADQVLMDGERLYLLDFDLYCVGDGGVDIGNFAAHLTEYALRTAGDPTALVDRERALVERYVELSGESALPSVRVYTTLTLLRHVYLSTQLPARGHATAALLELCEERLLSVGAAPACGAPLRISPSA